MGATGYVTPPGALDYLRADDFTARASQNLLVHGYEPAGYAQHGVAPFVSHLSIMDVVANLGWQGSARYVRTASPCLREFEELR